MRQSILKELDKIKAMVDPEEIWDVWVKLHKPTPKRAFETLGEKFPGYTKAVNDLANYAANYATDLRHPNKGYDRICDKIEDSLLKDYPF